VFCAVLSPPESATGLGRCFRKQPRHHYQGQTNCHHKRRSPFGLGPVSPVVTKIIEHRQARTDEHRSLVSPSSPLSDLRDGQRSGFGMATEVDAGWSAPLIIPATRTPRDRKALVAMTAMAVDRQCEERRRLTIHVARANQSDGLSNPQHDRATTCGFPSRVGSGKYKPSRVGKSESCWVSYFGGRTGNPD